MRKKYATDEERKAARRARDAANMGAILAKNAAYRAANPERVREWNERYRANNPDQFRKSQREYKKRRYWSDGEYRIMQQLRSRLSKAVGRGSAVTAAVAHCGCTAKELVAKIESHFLPGMSWDARSAWHIDHIYPIGAIDSSDRAQVVAVNNWRNLRPVWADDNRRKSDSVTPEAAALFCEILTILTPGDASHAAEV